MGSTWAQVVLQTLESGEYLSWVSVGRLCSSVMVVLVISQKTLIRKDCSTVDRDLVLIETRAGDHEATEILNTAGFFAACFAESMAQTFRWMRHCFRCARGSFHPQPHILPPSTVPSMLGQIFAVGDSMQTPMKL